MRGAWEGLLARTPSLVTNSSWFKDLTRDIGQPIMEGSKGADASAAAGEACAADCLDLGAFAAMMNFEPRCVCSQQMLGDVKSKMRVSWRDSVWALASLAASAIAGSFVLIAAVASLINSRRDLREIKTAKAAAAAEGGGGAAAADAAATTGGGLFGRKKKAAADDVALVAPSDVEASAGADQVMTK